MSRLGLLTAACLLCSATNAHASPIEVLADQLEPGEWAEFPTDGFGLDLLVDVGGHHLFQYTDEAHWDGSGEQLIFLGQGHSSNWDDDPSTPSRLLLYGASQNSWSTGPTIPAGNIGHQYDHSALDVARRRFYHRPFNQPTIHVFDVDGGAWVDSLDLPENLLPAHDCCGGLEYFPERDTLFFADGSWGIVEYSIADGTWIRIADTQQDVDPDLPDLYMGAYHNFSEYNPVRAEVLFGGGNDFEGPADGRDLYAWTDAGELRTLERAPFGLGITQSVVTVDPNSGMYLIAVEDGFFEYDSEADTWAQLSDPPHFADNADGRIFGTVAAPITDLGVVWFMTWNWEDSKIWLYRHSPGDGQPLPGGTGGGETSGSDTGAGSTGNPDDATSGGDGATSGGDGEAGSAGPGGGGTGTEGGPPADPAPMNDGAGAGCSVRGGRCGVSWWALVFFGMVARRRVHRT